MRNTDSWDTRYKTMGDLAEREFEALEPFGPAVRFGWDRPPIYMGNMTNAIAHMPDFYTESGYLVEVMGCGKDGIVKLREDKYRALLEWDSIQFTYLWVWNSDTFQSLAHAVEDLNGVIFDTAYWEQQGFMPLDGPAPRVEVKTFPEGRRYYAIPFEDLFEEALWVR